ncbi:MAG: PadR family transcriptional regulator [Candidatus Bipolaricaulaceae bacterium]
MAEPGFPADYAVLGALLDGPAHGYELRRRIAAGLGSIWHIAQSQLYAVLPRLQRRGLVTCHLQPQGSRPPRKVYALTPAGEQAVRRWAGSPVGHVRDIRVELLAKLYFLRRHAPGAAGQLLACQRDRLTRLEHRLARRGVASDDPLIGRIALDFRLRTVRALLNWIDAAVDELTKEVPDA